jgi:hypothetical protein
MGTGIVSRCTLAAPEHARRLLIAALVPLALGLGIAQKIAAGAQALGIVAAASV